MQYLVPYPDGIPAVLWPPGGEDCDGRADVALVGGVDDVVTEGVKGAAEVPHVATVPQLEVLPLDASGASRGVPPGGASAELELLRRQLPRARLLDGVAHLAQTAQLARLLPTTRRESKRATPHRVASFCSF